MRQAALKSLFLLHFLLIMTNLRSQKGYQPGYIITYENDTISGMIKDRKQTPYAKIHKKVRFKGKSFLTERYSPVQIAGYNIDGVIFESVWVKVTSEFFRTGYISEISAGSKCFMKVIVKGYLTYYQWEQLDQESITIDHTDLFKRTDDNYFVRVTQGIAGLKKSNLTRYFMDCPALIQMIQTGNIKKPLEIAQFYNRWVEENDF